MGITKLTPEQELEIVNLYQQGDSVEKIAGTYGVSNGTIINTLKKHNIESRRPSKRNKEKIIITLEQELEIINLYQKGLSIQKIAPMYNLLPVPLSNILHKHNVKMNTTGKNKLTHEQELDVVNLYQQPLAAEKVASMYGVAIGTIINTLRKHNIEPRRPSGRKEKIITPEQELEVINIYQQGLTIKKVAPMYNLSPLQLSNILHKHNIKIHTMGKNKLKPKQELEVINLYQQQMLTGEKIAGMYGVSNATIICTLKKYNIEPRRPSGRNKEKIITLEQELEIVNLYQQGLTIQKIAPMYNLSPLPLSNILHKHNVEVHKSAGRKEKIITPEQELEIINLYKQGFSLQKIALICGIAIPLVRKKIAKNNIVIRPTKSYIKITPEQELEIENLYKQGHTIEKIANLCGISKSSVFKTIKNNNLNIYKAKQKKIITPKQELEIINLYQQDYTIEKIAGIYEVSKPTISKSLKKSNVIPHNSKSYSIETTPEQELEIINLYQQGDSVEKIANICKIPKPIIRNRLKKHNTREKLNF